MSGRDGAHGFAEGFADGFAGVRAAGRGLRGALALVLAGLAFAATAVDATEPPPSPPAAETAPAAADPHCLQSTGSRLRTGAGRPCTGAPGQVITREELETGGAVTLGGAIARRVPAAGGH